MSNNAVSEQLLDRKCDDSSRVLDGSYSFTAQDQCAKAYVVTPSMKLITAL